MSQEQKELLYEQLMAEGLTGSYVSEYELSEMSLSETPPPVVTADLLPKDKGDAGDAEAGQAYEKAMEVGKDKEGQPLVMPGDAHWSYIDED